jgi:hypothetical protein
MSWGLLSFVVGCGQVVAIKLPNQDPNPSAFYLCQPTGDGAFTCESGRKFHQYDAELAAARNECAFGIANVYVETSWRGKVTHIQYQCSTPPVGGFPNDDAGVGGGH